MRVGNEAAAAIGRGYIDVDGRQLHYRRSGASGPPLFLLHEAPLSSGIFVPSLPLIGQQVSAWAFDLPGYGMSDPLAGGSPTIEGYAQTIVAAADRLRLEQFAICGVHTGALLAIEIASRIAPSRVPHLILGGVPMFTDEQRGNYATTWPERHVGADGGHLPWAWDRYRATWGQDTPVELLHYAAVETAGNLPGYNAASQASYAYDAASRLGAISAPTLVINAEHGLFAHLDAQVLAAIGRSQQVVIPGIGGQMPWRTPDAFSRAVVSFLTGRRV